MRHVVVASVLVVLSTLVPAVGARGADAVPCYDVADFGIPWTTRLEGDVDGDRRVDVVTTTARWRPDGTCRAWLAVDVNDALLRTPIEPSVTPLLEPPGLAGLVDLRPGPGLEIAVVVWLGASTGFLDVYGLRDHRLARLSSDEFAYGGSIVNRSGLDCVHARGARLVSSTATYVYRDERYHVVRRFFSLRAGILSPIAAIERYRVGPAGLGRLPEFRSPEPFPSCTVAPGTA